MMREKFSSPDLANIRDTFTYRLAIALVGPKLSIHRISGDICKVHLEYFNWAISYL